MPYAQRALALCEKLSAEYEDLLYPLSGLGRIYLALGEPRRAVPLLERALRLPPPPPAAPPPPPPRLPCPRPGARRRALPLLERALRLPTYPGAAPALAEARFALARALWES